MPAHLDPGGPQFLKCRLFRWSQSTKASRFGVSLSGVAIKPKPTIQIPEANPQRRYCELQKLFFFLRDLFALEDSDQGEVCMGAAMISRLLQLKGRCTKVAKF